MTNASGRNVVIALKLHTEDPHQTTPNNNEKNCKTLKTGQKNFHQTQ